MDHSLINVAMRIHQSLSDWVPLNLHCLADDHFLDEFLPWKPNVGNR